MAKTAIELALELADIFDKQKELAARELQIRHELQQIQSQVADMQKPLFSNPPSIQGIITQGIANSMTNGNNWSNWNIGNKIDKKTANVLKRTKRIMTNREVAETIAEIEGNFDPEYVKLLVRKFSAVVGGKAKNKRVFRRIEIDGVLHYGLADWFNADGSYKPEYAPAE